ncbi:ABC transporter substrate-binding protein [Alloiococcus sp. CFN-8]|uniref:ABC transporter substrate-binding protein n=1 Tax=Alloiococcus sp. CFN-8 TaxID=3416081 RepID=UPI003CE7A944
MFMKRMVSSILLTLVLAIGLMGCSNAEVDKNSSDGKINLKFMGWGNDAEVATFQSMIDQFEDIYPNVNVEYIVVPSSDYDTKMQNMIAADEQPDVFYLGIDYLMKYAATGNLYDLTDYVENNDIFDVDNIWENAVNIYKYDGTGLGTGQIYALPKDVSAFSIVYNKDLFEEAGVIPPTEEDPWDWNDYLEAAKKLTNGDVYGTAMYSMESAVWSNGADWLDDSTTEVAFTDPKFVEAFQFVADLRSKYHVAPSSAEEESLSSYDRFMQGKLGMMGVGSWATADLWNNTDFEWDLMDWPVSPNTGEKAVWFGSAGLAVSPKSENLEAACNLAAFLAFNEEAQRTSYTTGMSVPTLKDMAYGEYMDMDKSPENKKAFLNVLEQYGRLATQSKTFNQEWWNEFNSGINSVYDGEISAQEYCDSVAEKVQNLLNESLEQHKALK